MKKWVRTVSVLFVCIGFIFGAAVAAKAAGPDEPRSQDGRERRRPDDQPPRKPGKEEKGQNGRERAGESGYITDELKAKVKAILSQYDPSSLTAEDAKAINNAFRAAGIRRGPGQRDAIRAAGFDPKKISTLDPPPSEPKRQGDAPGNRKSE